MRVFVFACIAAVAIASQSLARLCSPAFKIPRGSGIFDFGCASWSVVYISPVSAIGSSRHAACAHECPAFGVKQT
jgi:hypothetical protein